MENSWKSAIVRVLTNAGRPLHYREITEAILSGGHYRTDGATPADSVNAHISSSIKHEGARSPFMRVDRGIFALNPAVGALAPNAPAAPAPGAGAEPDTVDDQDVEQSDSIIRAFGMYWERDQVRWKSAPRLHGRQTAQASAVDFGGQRGIYVLYDHHTPIYVGRAIDRPLGQRLWEHASDRLKSRWNRFSWFGLLAVAADGTLQEKPLAVNLASLIATLEAVLIEAMEPPQNRRRGDDFMAAEFIQAPDPEQQEQELRHTLMTIGARLRQAP